MKKLVMIISLGISLAACSERNPPRNDNGSGLPGNAQQEKDDDTDKEDGNHGDDDTRSEQNDRSN